MRPASWIRSESARARASEARKVSPPERVEGGRARPPHAASATANNHSVLDLIAEIQAGDSPSGSFETDSSSQTVSGKTTFTLDGRTARYYVVWITQLPPSGRAEIGEVTATFDIAVDVTICWFIDINFDVSAQYTKAL